MEKNVFSLGICLLLIACSPENELDPDPTSEARLVTKTELISDSIPSLDSLDINLLSSSGDPFDKIYPEIGNLPAPRVSEGYTNNPENIFSLQIGNPFCISSGGYNSTLGRYYGKIQIQWRLRNKTQWYNYHPQRRNWEELYTDIIYNKLINEAYYPQKPQWEHSLNAKALPHGDIQFRARLILDPTYDSSRPLEDATLWSQPTYFMHNYYGNDFDLPGKEGSGDYVTARIKAHLGIWALRRVIPDKDTQYETDRIESPHILYVKVSGKDMNYDGPLYSFTTSKKVMIGEPINFIYDAEIAVKYTTPTDVYIRTEYTNKKFVHPIYIDQNNLSDLDYDFYDEIEIP
ncbi:hypothetical protein [Parabacteroides pacaensis]|uniref:hypothetical protein n=1 Tax=Parabacteroides pacaensis TaxID=2086575 RepID=UPI000D0FE976|nr:hypothetical protein [Parabacteroides pacaensis]